tara:strand:+ start:68 stop:901 length:834 start_codon:yes stop_codon:yes gene_type:complete
MTVTINGSTGVTIAGDDDTDLLNAASSGTRFSTFTDDSTGEVRLKAHDGTGGTNSKFMTFYTQPAGGSAAEAVRINNDKSVIFKGRGLDVTRPGGDTSIELGLGATGNQWCYIDLVADATYTDYGLRFLRANTGPNTGSVINHRGTGNLGVSLPDGGTASYPTSSDYRLKENVVSISDGITKLKTLKPYRFNYKANKDKVVDGFFAHEATAVPGAVTGTKDEVMSEDGPLPGDLKKGDPVYQSIDYSKYTPLLTAALQEAVAKIEVLETKVAALEGT